MRALMRFLIASLLCSAGIVVRECNGLLAHEGPTVPTKNEQVATTAPQAKVQEGALFHRLVGTWDVSYELYDKNGGVRRYSGQATYTWILDGGALQEIWTSDYHNKQPQPYGTTIDFYDAKRQRWTAVWIYPEQGMTTVVSGGEVDGRMVLTGPDEGGAIQRWSYSDIQADSFVGRFESSNDQGKTWRLLGVNHMHRHHA